MLSWRTVLPMVISILLSLSYSPLSVSAEGENKQLEKVLSESGGAGGVLNIELNRYALGLKKMLDDNINTQLDGAKLIKASSNCLESLGYEATMVDGLKNRIYKSLIVTFEHMDKIDQVQLVERSFFKSDDAFRLPSLDDCSSKTKKLIKQ